MWQTHWCEVTALRSIWSPLSHSCFSKFPLNLNSCLKSRWKNVCFVNSKIIPEFVLISQISGSQTDKQKTAESRKCVGDAASHLKIFWFFWFGMTFVLSEVLLNINQNLGTEVKHSLLVKASSTFQFTRENNVWSDSMQNKLLGFFLSAADHKENNKSTFHKILLLRH